MTALLAAQEVSKIYQMGSNSVTALDNVSLEINEGEFVAIQGTSGSGKSTLLNMLGGLDHPTKGEVFFATRPLGPFTKKEMARYRRFSVGMIFQNFNLIPTMTARENVRSPSRSAVCVDSSDERVRVSYWRVSVLAIDFRTNLLSFPAVNNNVLPSLAPSQTIPKCYWQMSRQEMSTRSVLMSCWDCCGRWSIRIR